MEGAIIWAAMIPTKPCKCGCGQIVCGKRVFVNKEHQLVWMNDGGARSLNELLPHEVRSRAGHVSGNLSAASGRLDKIRVKAARATKRIAREFRKRAASKPAIS